MKTPMQEMFDQLKASKKDDYGLAFAIDMLLENEESMLEKEKAVIMDAVTQGWDYNEEGLVRWLGEKYYNETFVSNVSELVCTQCGGKKDIKFSAMKNFMAYCEDCRDE